MSDDEKPTTAEPPRVAAAPLWAPRSSDVDPRPLKTAMIAAAYGVEVVDVLPVTTGGTAPNPWALLDEARKERDEAERLLLAIITCDENPAATDDAWCKECAHTTSKALEYLRRRNLITTEGA